MFKAKLIEDKTYYRRRNTQLILFMLAAIPAGLIISSLDAPLWVTILVLAIYVLSFFLMFNNQKVLSAMLGKRWIEIDEEALRIKTDKGKILQSFKINALEKIIVKDHYAMPNENLKDMAAELKGHPKMNYLIITSNDEDIRFDFEIDSYFMADQLHKTIQYWNNKGHVIETA
jgi:hypothetical protein